MNHELGQLYLSLNFFKPRSVPNIFFVDHTVVGCILIANDSTRYITEPFTFKTGLYFPNELAGVLLERVNVTFVEQLYTRLLPKRLSKDSPYQLSDPRC